MLSTLSNLKRQSSNNVTQKTQITIRNSNGTVYSEQQLVKGLNLMSQSSLGTHNRQNL